MIPIYQPFITTLEKKYVNQCLDSNWISSKGEFIRRFEDSFAQFIHAKYVTSVCNGTVAIHLALTVLGLGPGDEVIVPSLTYVASVNTIVQTGASPVFADSLESSWQIDPQEILSKITSKTKAILIVHLYGQSCEMDQIVQICRDHNLFLIEDCAEAFGTYYKGQHVGTFGDVGTFSFFGNKTITTGEGGILVTHNQALFEKAYHMKNQGVSKDREYWHDIVAYNYRMTNISAAIGLGQIERAEEILEKKHKISLWYQEELKSLPVKFHLEIPETHHSYWMCSILVAPAHRQVLRDHLKEAGIETRPLFYPVHTLPPYACSISLPIAESLASRGINLPSYPELSRSQIIFICEKIRQFYLLLAQYKKIATPSLT